MLTSRSPTSVANPTSYAYYPYGVPEGGDIWFGTQYDYSQAKLGNYYFATALHELGHSLGLKHRQDTAACNVSVPFAHDALEYTIMSYRSYVGGSTNGGYTNEAYGYPQTYMANDILALQTLYGADYATQNGNTVYTWSPTTGQLFINGVGQLAPGSEAAAPKPHLHDDMGWRRHRHLRSFELLDESDDQSQSRKLFYIFDRPARLSGRWTLCQW